MAIDSIKDLLEFIPSIEEIEHGLTSHGEEAEEIVDKLDNELDKITEFLEPKVDLESTLSALHHSTPKAKGVTFQDEKLRSILYHDNISLSNALDKLRTARRKAIEDSTETSRE